MLLLLMRKKDKYCRNYSKRPSTGQLNGGITSGVLKKRQELVEHDSGKEFF